MKRKDFLGCCLAFGSALMINPGKIFGDNRECFASGNLEQIMNIALKPKGDVISIIHYPTFNLPLGDVNASIRLESMNNGNALRTLVYLDEDSLCKANLDMIDVFLVSRHQSRYEIKELIVYQNRQQDIANYVAVGQELEDTGTLIDKLSDTVFSVISKIGINKSDLIDMMEMMNPSVFPDATRISRFRQEAIGKSNIMLKSPVYLKKLSYNGGQGLDLTSIRDTKLWEFIIEEGEAAVEAMMVIVKPFGYRELKLVPGAVPFAEAGFYGKSERQLFPVRMQRK